jgi:hypothetical protein
MSLPYQYAQSGSNALTEAKRILTRLGATTVGEMESGHHLTLFFELRGERVRIEVDAMSYARLWLKSHPFSARSRITDKDHQARAVAIGRAAIKSIIRDWIKAQATAIELGAIDAVTAFLPFMVMPDGGTVAKHVASGGMAEIGLLSLTSDRG